MNSALKQIKSEIVALGYKSSEFKVLNRSSSTKVFDVKIKNPSLSSVDFVKIEALRPYGEILVWDTNNTTKNWDEVK